MTVFTMRHAWRDLDNAKDVRKSWNDGELFEIIYCANLHFVGERFRQSDLIDGVSVRIEYANGTRRITCKVRSDNV